MWIKVFASSLLLVFLVEVEFSRTTHAGCAGCGGCDPVSGCSGLQALGQGQFSAGGSSLIDVQGQVEGQISASDSSLASAPIAASDVQYQSSSLVDGVQQSAGGSDQVSFESSQQVQDVVEEQGQLESTGVVSSTGVAQSIQSETQRSLPVPIVQAPGPVIVQQQPQPSVVYQPIRTAPVQIEPRQSERVVMVTGQPVRYQTILSSPAPVFKEIVIRQTGVQLPTIPFAPCVPTQSFRRKFYVLVNQALPQLSLPVPVQQSGYKILLVSCSITKKVTYKVILKLADTSCYQINLRPQLSAGVGQWSPYYSVVGSSTASCPIISEQRPSYCQL